MLGLLFISILLAYIAFWTWIATRFKSKAARAVVALVAFLIPTWDYFPQRYYFHKLCKTEAGQRLYAEPIVVEGFYDKDMGFEGAKGFIENLGYHHIETYGFDAGKVKLMRVELNTQGRIVKNLIDSVTTRYESQGFTEERPWSLYAGGKRIVDRATGKTVAASIGIYQGPTWIVRALVPKGFAASGDPCFGDYGENPLPILERFLSPPTDIQPRGRE